MIFFCLPGFSAILYATLSVDWLGSPFIRGSDSGNGLTELEKYGIELQSMVLS